MSALRNNPNGPRGLERLHTINSNAIIDKQNSVAQYSNRSVSVEAFFELESMQVSRPTIPSHVIIINDIPPKETLNLACLIHMSQNLVLDPIFNHRMFTISHMFTNSTLTQLRLIFVNSSTIQMQRLKVYLAIKNYCSMFVECASLTVVQLVDYGFVFKVTSDDYWHISFTISMCSISPPAKSIVFRPLCYNVGDVLLMDIYEFNQMYNSLTGFMKITGLLQNEVIRQFSTQCTLATETLVPRCVD